MALLEILENRPTFFLEEPLIKSLRRRFQIVEVVPRRTEISPEEAVKFVENWASKLVSGWIETFFGDLPEDEKKRLKEIMKRSFLKKVVG